MNHKTLRIRYIIFCISFFLNYQANAQFVKAFKAWEEFITNSAKNKTLTNRIQKLSNNSIKSKSEQEAFDSFNKHSLIVSGDKILQLYNADVMRFENGIISHGNNYKKYSNSNVIVFASQTQKNNFLYLTEKNIISQHSSDPLADYKDFKIFLANEYGVTQINIYDPKTINAVNDIRLRNILIDEKFIDLKSRTGDITFELMVFQKACNIPVTGKLDYNTTNILDKFIKKSYEGGSYGAENVGRFYGYKDNYFSFVKERMQFKYLDVQNFQELSVKQHKQLNIPYLNLFSKKNLIPIDERLWTNLVVEKGLFKYQKMKGLPLTGVFSKSTLQALDRDINNEVDDFFSINSNETFTYKGLIYDAFNKIPFQKLDKLSFDRALTPMQASYLMERGVKFIYNKTVFLKQRANSFKIIYLISKDTQVVQKLYGLDEEHSNKLIKLSLNIINNPSIIKASSFEEMIQIQNKIIDNQEVPILIFHNNIDQSSIEKFNPASNFITCNSFNIRPDAYLTSTDFLDMEAIIQGINTSYNNKTLEGFYFDFTNQYYIYMKQKSQQATLVYFSSASVVGAGVYIIVYYNSNKEK